MFVVASLDMVISWAPASPGAPFFTLGLAPAWITKTWIQQFGDTFPFRPCSPWSVFVRGGVPTGRLHTSTANECDAHWFATNTGQNTITTPPPGKRES